MTDCWYKDLWDFVLKQNIMLKDECPVLPPLLWERDEFVMEKLTHICGWGKKAFIWFN
jgi:hypothetical protein